MRRCSSCSMPGTSLAPQRPWCMGTRRLIQMSVWLACSSTASPASPMQNGSIRRWPATWPRPTWTSSGACLRTRPSKCRSGCSACCRFQPPTPTQNHHHHHHHHRVPTRRTHAWQPSSGCAQSTSTWKSCEASPNPHPTIQYHLLRIRRRHCRWHWHRRHSSPPRSRRCRQSALPSPATRPSASSTTTTSPCSSMQALQSSPSRQSKIRSSLPTPMRFI
mmetsp:Transcript_99381/g.280439  ORF Transcript_99381/g.280439 Transcript_99381/m.280439 type:complete len:219 (-) Transcript_99381:390-1046(-)